MLMTQCPGATGKRQFRAVACQPGARLQGEACWQRLIQPPGRHRQIRADSSQCQVDVLDPPRIVQSVQVNARTAVSGAQ